jgi:Cu-processing system permease protein
MEHHTFRIFKYEFQNLLRSRWLVTMACLLLAVTEVLFRFGGDIPKTITSLMNVVLIVVPMIALVLGTIYFYNSREFNELLLAQPINRTSIYMGKLGGFIGALTLSFVAGVGIPFLIHAYQLGAYAWKVATLLSVGICFITIFTALAFFAATRYDDRIKGLGFAILAWFLLAVLYDGVILLFVYLFQDYPYEPALLAMVFLNPIDLGRILILLQLDISALMGYTGAVFRNVFGTNGGLALSAGAMAVYASMPLLWGLRTFKRKDF